MKSSFGGCLLFLAVLISFGAWGHPHGLIVVEQTFVFDETGLREIRSLWRYDAFASTDLFGAYDTDADGELSSLESAKLAARLEKDLHKDHYFTRLVENGVERFIDAIENPEVAMERYKILFSFSIPCRMEAADAVSEVRIEQYDPSYYIAFEYAEPSYRVLHSDAFEWWAEKRVNKNESFYGGTVYPEEVILRFNPNGMGPVKNQEAVDVRSTGSPLEGEAISGKNPPQSRRFYTAFISWILEQENAVRQRLEELATKSADGALRMDAVLWLCFIAFLYGVFHAAGPGHGKSITASYLLGDERSLSSGILLGVLFALFHGFSGIVAVVVGRVLLGTTALSFLGNADKMFKVVSFGAITLWGAIMLGREAYRWIRRKDCGVHNTDAEGTIAVRQNTNVILLAFAAGFIPCPSVVLVMLFCSGSGHVMLGIALASCVMLGMAVTICTVGLMVSCTKMSILGRLSSVGFNTKKIANTLHLFAWSLVLLLGIISLSLTFLGR